MQRRTYHSDDAIAAALRNSNGNSAAAARSLGCGVNTISAYKRRVGIPPGKRVLRTDAEIAAALVAADGVVKQAAAALGCCRDAIYHYYRRTDSVKWDVEHVARLTEAWVRTPRPTMRDVAVEFGTTRLEIKNVLSRHGLTRRRSIDDPAPAIKVRACITCQQPFASEGNGNHMCPRCLAESREIAP